MIHQFPLVTQKIVNTEVNMSCKYIHVIFHYNLNQKSINKFSTLTKHYFLPLYTWKLIRKQRNLKYIPNVKQEGPSLITIHTPLLTLSEMLFNYATIIVIVTGIGPGSQLTLTYHRVWDLRFLVRRRSRLRESRWWAGERSAWHLAASALVRSASECRNSPPVHPRTNIA